MKKIFEYELKIEDEQEIELSENADILTVQVQNNFITKKDDKLCLWAMVDENQTKVIRKIRIIGTGKHIEEPLRLKYLGTVQLVNGLVLHIFLEGE
jgi:hypothetical protein